MIRSTVHPFDHMLDDDICACDGVRTRNDSKRQK